MGSCFQCYFMNYFVFTLLKIILVLDICPLRPEIARYSIRFPVNLLIGYVKHQVIFLGTCGSRKYPYRYHRGNWKFRGVGLWGSNTQEIPEEGGVE